MPAPTLEDVWRQESPHVLGALLRRYAGRGGPADYADCEDAAQEALAAAAVQWPRDGMPDNPRGWLVRVAARRLVDEVRRDRARERRETTVSASEPADTAVGPAADAHRPEDEDEDPLLLLLLCCHPALSRPSQVALTLRAVSGLPTSAIAAAFLVPEATMAQRLTRARATLRDDEIRFERPSVDDLPGRVAAVLDVLYLVFNEGYTRSTGDELVDQSLADEAIRLTRHLAAHLPDHDEVCGALALMLLTDSRRAARRDDAGDLVPLAEQDRSRWDAEEVREGVAIVERVLPRGRVGPYQLQAAIAAVHAEADAYAATDWPQIAALYAMLADVAPGSAVTLNRAVAVGMADGARAGLALLRPLLAEPRLRRWHRLHAVHAHLLEEADERRPAAEAYRRALELTASRPEQRYLAGRLRRLAPPGGSG